MILMKPRKIIVLLVLLLAVFPLAAQPTPDEQLAEQFYKNKEFDKALDYYEKLYNKISPQQYYQFYYNCLLETKDYKKAEKIVKKQLKQSPESLNYMVDLGVVYQRSEDENKCKQTWEQTIKAIKKDDQVFAVANAFMGIKQYDYAIAAYQKGRKITANNYPYNFELATVYKEKGDKMAMIGEYLDVLELNESFMQAVQNSLQTSFAADADQKQNELLKTELLKRIQKSPDKIILSEFLIWIQIQQKDWEGAYIQCKALDKRKKEDGARLVGLGSICTQNENYEMAAKCYSYVLSLGKQSEYYTTSRMELIKVQYLNVTKKGAYTSNDLTELDKNFNETITELGKSATTEPILLKYAHLKAFYLNKTDEAIALLEETIALPQMQPQAQAECKLELGDILLMTGDVWEASLRYSQVDKSFKHDEIGNEAKFRNARISYYTGDFKWAQAQLDVLKGATSKLIANDAMELSLRISDALAIDTNEAPLMIFARADLLAFQNKDDLALVTLDSINKLYPHHALADDILYKKAEIVLKHAKFQEAAAYYDTIVKQYGEDVLADDALYHLADLTENQFKNPDKAKEMYQQLLEKYPASLYVVEARKRFRKLRGDSIN